MLISHLIVVARKRIPISLLHRAVRLRRRVVRSFWPRISFVKGVTTTAELESKSMLESHGISVTVLCDESTLIPKPAQIVGAENWDAFAVQKIDFRPVRQFAIANGTYVPKFSATITQDGLLLDDLSLEFGGPSGDIEGYERAIFASRTPKVDVFNGRLLVVDSAGFENPFHWIVNVLPKFVWANSKGVEFDALAVRFESKFHRDVFEEFLDGNVPIVPISDKRSVKADMLLVSNLPCSPGATLPSVLKEIRQKFVCSSPSASRRKVYVSRQHARGRRLAKGMAVEAALEKHGFETVLPESLSHSQRRAVFGSASVILGVHGAGLTNMIYAPEDCAVIEIMNPGYRNVSYWLLAESLGLDYLSIVGDGELSSRDSDSYDCFGDVRIKPDALTELLKCIK